MGLLMTPVVLWMTQRLQRLAARLRLLQLAAQLPLSAAEVLQRTGELFGNRRQQCAVRSGWEGKVET